MPTFTIQWMLYWRKNLRSSPAARSYTSSTADRLLCLGKKGTFHWNFRSHLQVRLQLSLCKYTTRCRFLGITKWLLLKGALRSPNATLAPWNECFCCFSGGRGISYGMTENLLARVQHYKLFICMPRDNHCAVRMSRFFFCCKLFCVTE